MVISTGELAELLALYPRRLQQLVKAGILKHAYDPDDNHELRGRFVLRESIRSYVIYQRTELGAGDVTETELLQGTRLVSTP